jgi:hypothetical protein
MAITAKTILIQNLAEGSGRYNFQIVSDADGVVDCPHPVKKYVLPAHISVDIDRVIPLFDSTLGEYVEITVNAHRQPQCVNRLGIRGHVFKQI